MVYEPMVEEPETARYSEGSLFRMIFIPKGLLWIGIHRLHKAGFRICKERGPSAGKEGPSS